jgi:glycine/D-amino acid oxidase-like deaminating enzyme
MRGICARVCVVGGGFQGLTTALLLLQTKKYYVDVIWEKSGTAPPHGLWELPAYHANPEDRVSKWAIETFAHFLSLKEDQKSGIYYPISYYTLSRQRCEENPYATHLHNYRHGPHVLQEPTLQEACGDHLSQFVDAIAYDTVVIDSVRHLEWLRSAITDCGGAHIRRRLSSLTELKEYDWVINCSGIGAHNLCNDNTVYPIKGNSLYFLFILFFHYFSPQLSHLNFLTSTFSPQYSHYTGQLLHGYGMIHCAIVDAETDAYVIPLPPHSDPQQHLHKEWAVELGGSIEKDVWDRTPTQQIQQRILERAHNLLTTLPKPLDGWAGLRPARHGGVRFEVEKMMCGVRVIHCYGHGGSGILTSYGCGKEILHLLEMTPKM